MSNTQDIVRRIVGRRHKISRQEMIDILLALPMEIVPASTITGRSSEGRLYVGGEFVSNPADEARATAAAWAKMCSGITCVSVLQSAYYRDEEGPLANGLGVRHDQPGSMHPQQRAEILFAPAELQTHEYDQIGQLRRHAERVLVVE